MPKVLLANPLKRRLPYRENTVEGILLYGKDNLYPQRMDVLLSGSGAGKSSVKLFGKFIRGAGWRTTKLNDGAINVFGQSPKELLREAVQDYRIHYGYAIHVDYNAFLQPVNPKVIKFEYCRLGLPDELGNITKIVVSDDWAQEKNKIKKRQRVDVFNPDAEVVLRQIERCGGLEHYRGQILYVTENVNQYPACTFDEVVPDVATDAGISIFRESSVNTKFMADYWAEYPGEFESETERQEFATALTKFQGVQNSGRIMLIENKHAPEKPITLHKFDIQDTDRLFEWTDNSAQTKIRKNYTQPSILVGDLIPGRLGNTTEIENSVNFYNMFTHDDRDLVSTGLKKVLRLVPGLEDVTDWAIQPLTWQMFLQSLGVATPTATPEGQPAATNTTPISIGNLGKVLNIGKKYTDGKLTKDQALVALATYGISGADAEKFLIDAEDGELGNEE